MKRILKSFRPFLYHQNHNNEAFEMLYKRFDNQVPNYPRTEAFENMLTRMLKPEQAEFLSRIPRGIVPVSEMVEKYEGVMNEEEVLEMLDGLFKLGMLLDNHEKYFHFPEMIVGWYEFVWMIDRTGELPMDDLVDCTLEYMRYWKKENVREDPNYPNQLRIVCREESIPQNHEVLDYESARKVIENADVIGIGDCCCHRLRSKEMEPEKAKKYNEKYPIRRCFGIEKEGGEKFFSMLLKHNLGEIIEKKEALEILEECYELGLVQNVDNQKNPLYICNCEKQTCGALEPLRYLSEELLSDDDNDYNYVEGEKPRLMMAPVTPSRFIASSVDIDKCIGCSTCVDLCPSYCFSINNNESEEKKNKKTAELDNTLCIGCGVCYSFCKFEAIEMIERENGDGYISSLNIPDSMLRRKIDSVVELGKIHLVLFNDDEKLIHRLLQPIFRVFENSAVGKKVFKKESFRQKMVEKTIKKAQDLMKDD